MTEVIDSNESVVNRYRYTPFGQSMVKNESVYNPYQYTGRRYDEERGNYYYRARIYDQQQSRFLSNDPAGQGANLYAYVGNNPTNRRDPSGEMIFGTGVPPRMYDGHIGGRRYPKGYEPCSDSSYDSVSDCMDYYINQGATYNAQSYCISLCGGRTIGPVSQPTRVSGKFDFSTFISCLFPTETSWQAAFTYASHIGCASAILTAATLTATTAGVGTPAAALIVGTGCTGSGVSVGYCLDQAAK